MKRPTSQTIKRLYAVSGNRCAFPKCPQPLVHEGKPTARICHIKAARPGGPRYDPKQSDVERHGYENLVLMCPIHADVIDNDEMSYTVTRLQTIKREHENNHQAVDELTDDQLNQFQISVSNFGSGSAVTNVFNQNVTSHNQSGGITAHTVVASIQRRMSDKLKNQILSELPRDKMIVVWSIAGNQESHTLATEVFAFLKANQFDVMGDGPVGNVFLRTPPKGIVFEPGVDHNQLFVGHPEDNRI